jgi:hypothetical protein
MVIARHGLGGTGATIEELTRAIARLLDSPGDWLLASRARHALISHSITRWTSSCGASPRCSPTPPERRGEAA